MNTKHIEQTHSEELTSELFDIAYTDRAGDLVTSSLSKPYARVSGTEEVKGDFTSYITELPATLKVFVRKLFSASAKIFGGKSMSQMFSGVKEAYDWLKERVKGSDGIPKKELPEVEDAAHLLENLRVLEGRDMVSGLTLTKTETGEDGTENVQQFSCPEGLSLARLLCSALSSQFTEIIDTNPGWTMTRQFPWSTFSNLTKITLCCINSYPPFLSSAKITELNMPKLQSISGGSQSDWLSNAAITELYLPELTTINWEGGSNKTCFYNLPNCRVLNFPKLINVQRIGNCSLISGCPVLEEILLPSFVGHSPTYGGWPVLIGGCPNLKKVVFGKLQYALKQPNENNSILHLGDNCIHLEFGEGTNVSLLLNGWSPTTAIAEHLDEFLSNFQTYIADRVADRTGQSALTLTLSSAVYAALEAQEGQTILATLTNKNWTVASA